MSLTDGVMASWASVSMQDKSIAHLQSLSVLYL
jgi:hypothetical protein